MTEQEYIAELLRWLEHVRSRPLMYFIGIEQGDSFLRGIHHATSIVIHTDKTKNYYGHVLVKRGWTNSSLRPWSDMLKSGMTVDEVVHEMLTIEIEYWTLVLDSLSTD